MTEETVAPQVKEEAVVEEKEELETEEKFEEPSETQVPLSALQKERRKRQELEMELKFTREQMQKKESAPEPDESGYETVTKEELTKHNANLKREITEERWIKENPERYEKVNELLPEFLKRRPNLAVAIAAATNRYEEAWELLDILSVKEVTKMTKLAAQKKDAPGSPASVPKAANMNETVDVMNMTDSEFAAWKRSKRKR